MMQCALLHLQSVNMLCGQCQAEDSMASGTQVYQTLQIRRRMQHRYMLRCARSRQL